MDNSVDATDVINELRSMLAAYLQEIAVLRVKNRQLATDLANTLQTQSET